MDDPVNDWFRNVDDNSLCREKSSLGGVQEVGEVLCTQWVVATGLDGLIVANQFAHSERFNAFTYASVQGVLLNTIFTSTLKYTVRRDRPDNTNRRPPPRSHLEYVNDGPRVGIFAYLTAGMVGV